MTADIENPPFVSVIMPVRNEADFIEQSLGSVLAQNYPHDRLEIIIADGRSTDETVELIKNLKKQTAIPVLIVDNPERIAPTGLNRAIAVAKGDIIVRVDGHCEIDRDYVANCVRHLVEKKAEGVGGPIETIGETLQAQAIAVAMSSRFGVGGSAFRTVNDREMQVDTVAFPGYTREILKKAGAFNEELVRNQDDEYNYRIRKLGGRILLAPDIRSRYYSRSSFRSLWRQYFQYGYWKVRVLQLHPKQMSVRQFVPFVFVASLISLTLLGFLWDFRPLLALLALYGAANLLATVKASSGIRAAGLPYVSLAYAILHFSYGLGFLSGLVAFRGKWRARPVVKTARPHF
jgi:succinoglycan biosynthesis protein ExoA